MTINTLKVRKSPNQKLKKRRIQNEFKKSPKIEKEHSLKRALNLVQDRANDFTSRMVNARKVSIQQEDRAHAPKLRGLKVSFDPLYAVPSADVSEELLSKVRISHKRISDTQLSSLVKGCSYIPLSKIAKESKSNDIPGNWITVGTMYEKSAQKTSEKGNKYMVIGFTDLKGYKANVFLFDEALEAHSAHEIGSLMLFLNPQVLKPSEVQLYVTFIF